jgi:hypothetical protein
MKKIILTLVLSLVLLIAFAPPVIAGELPKEGTYTGKMVISFPLKSIDMGDRLILAYEYLGVFLNDKGQGFLHNATVRGLGSLHMVKSKGVFEYDRSSAVFKDSDGDQLMFTHEVSGKVDSVRTLTFHDGTGKYAGIQGGGTWIWVEAGSAAEGTAQGYAIHTGHWKLP